MRLIVVIVAALLCCLPARAQGPGSPEAQVAAKELAEILSGDMIGQMTDAMTAQVWPKLQAALGGKVDAETLAELRAEFGKALQEFVVDMTKDAPAIYARHFSVQELNEMTAFYRTPTGVKALKLMPQIMADTFSSMMPRMETFDRDLQRRLEAILQKRGVK